MHLNQSSGVTAVLWVSCFRSHSWDDTLCYRVGVWETLSNTSPNTPLTLSHLLIHRTHLLAGRGLQVGIRAHRWESQRWKWPDCRVNRPGRAQVQTVHGIQWLEFPPWVWEIEGSNPQSGHTKDFKNSSGCFLHGTQYEVSNGKHNWSAWWDWVG